MQKYVRQLLADLQAAARPEEPPESATIYETKPQSLEEYFAAVDAWIEDKGPKERIGRLLSLEAIQFPPAERLSWRQMRALCQAFEHTMWTHHVSFDLPERLPWKNRYNLLRSKLDHEVEICDNGLITVEFCRYEPKNCCFGSRYCTCKQLFLTDFEQELSPEAQVLVRYLHEAFALLPEGKQFRIWENEEEEDGNFALLAKPIGEWLGIDPARLPPDEHWDYDDTIGIAEAMADLFPTQSWTWTIDALPSERYAVAVRLLNVPATYDHQGNFLTTAGEMEFFNRIADFYFQQRRKRKDEGNYGYEPDDLPF